MRCSMYRRTAVAALLVLQSAFSGCAQTLTVRVHPPRDTPDTATVYIAGSLPALGNWRPDGLAMTRQRDGSRTAAIRVPAETAVEFKITLGSWESEALYDSGSVPGNFRLTVHSDTTVELFPLTWKQVGFRPAGGVSGAVRYHRALNGEGLRYGRDLIVWLPPSYESDPLRHYPVLYMHDGQNIIDPRTSYNGHDWRMDEVCDSLIARKEMEEIIVVGIYNTPDRSPEYSDTERGRAYASFVVRVAKPMIDSLYRTRPGRTSTAVMGSSMGGLISFLFLWWHPDVFSMAGCFSSAFMVDDDRILREVESAKTLPSDIRLYLDCGTAGLDGSLEPGYARMGELLRDRGLVEGKTLLAFLDRGAEHNEQAWASRVWRPLKFFFGAFPDH